MPKREKKLMKMLKKMRRPRRKTKFNNKGMSLVEVIIAITILGVVVVPVLRAMTMAMAYNAKARRRQNMTVTAESIMETFKGYSLESLKTMFNGTTYGEENTGGIAGVQNGTYSYSVLTSEGEDGTVTESSGSYVFEIKDFEQNGKTYTATMTVTSNGTQEIYEAKNLMTTSNAVFKADSKYDNNLIDNAFNEYIANSEWVSAFYGTYFSEPHDDDGNPLMNKRGEYFETKIYQTGDVEGTIVDSLETAIPLLTSSDIKAHIAINDRTLTLDITNSGDVYKVEAKMVYHFYISGFPYYVLVEKEEESTVEDAYLEEGETKVTYEGETQYEEVRYTATYPQSESEYFTYEVCVDEFYSNAISPENLYIYYYPQYSYEDRIVINNEAAIDLDCFIIKQRSSDISINKTIVKEDGYLPHIQCKNDANMTMNLYHNFNTNIGNSDKISSGFTTPSGFTDSEDYSDITVFKKEEALSYIISLDITENDTVLSHLESSMLEKISDSEKASESAGETSSETSGDAAGEESAAAP